MPQTIISFRTQVTRKHDIALLTAWGHYISADRFNVSLLLEDSPEARQLTERILTDETFQAYAVEEVDARLADQEQRVKDFGDQKDQQVVAAFKAEISRLREEISSTLGKLPLMSDPIVRGELVAEVQAALEPVLQSTIAKLVQEAVSAELVKRGL